MAYKRILSLLLSLSLTACSSLGPDTLRSDRASYDDIVRQTDSQQILTNIVRLRYVEPTSFLEITSINASYSLSNSVTVSPAPSFSSTRVNGSPTSNTTIVAAGISPSISYSESPSISYAPINSSQAVTILQQPITFNEIAILLSGGIDDVSLFGRLLFNRVNSLDNAVSATNPYVVNKIEYEDYYKFLAIFGKLLKEKKSHLVPATYNGNVVFNLVFAPGVAQSADAIKMKKMLGVNLKSKNIVFTSENINPLIFNSTGEVVVDETQSKGSNIVFVETRSIYSIMTYLAHAVQVPPEDIQSNITQESLDEKGVPFVWSPLIQGIMTIYSSDSSPSDAFIKTYVHNHWFYIKNSDIQSKATFSLLMRLITLTGGIQAPTNAQGPVLTLPAIR